MFDNGYCVRTSFDVCSGALNIPFSLGWQVEFEPRNRYSGFPPEELVKLYVVIPFFGGRGGLILIIALVGTRTPRNGQECSLSMSPRRPRPEAA